MTDISIDHTSEHTLYIPEYVNIEKFNAVCIKAKKLQTKNVNKITKLNNRISQLEKEIENISSVLYKYKIRDFIIDITDGSTWQIMDYNVPKHSGMLYQARKVGYRYAIWEMEKYAPKYNEIKFFNNENIVKFEDSESYIDVLLNTIKKYNKD